MIFQSIKLIVSTTALIFGRRIYGANSPCRQAKKFEVCLEANLRTKRKEPYKNAFRIQSKSVVVHFYNKQFQMNKVFGDEFPKGQDAKDIIRLEVQCKKRKMNNLKQYYQISGKTLEDFRTKIYPRRYYCRITGKRLDTRITLP